MKQTRKQRRAENRRRHREMRGRKVITYDDLIARDRNPVVAFRARGRAVRFTTKPKRRGKVPSHLRPYLFKSRR